MPMVEDVMREADLAYDGLDVVAVTVGPGTFAGCRIGLAAARAIGLSAHKSVVGLTTLEALAGAALSLADGAPVLAVIDARRGEVYAQLFGANLAAIGTAAALTPEAAAGLVGPEPVVLVGSGAPLLRPLLTARGALIRLPARPEIFEQPDAAVVARIAASRGQPSPHRPAPVPCYLRRPDAKLPPE